MSTLEYFPRKQAKWIARVFFLCSVSVFLYYSFNYEEAWYQIERGGWNYQLSHRIQPDSFFKNLLLAFDSELIEQSPHRVSRPFSSLLEILDYYLRTELWKYMLPHPTLSITTFFSILSIFVFLSYLKKNGISTFSALNATSILLCSSGFLSLQSMRFRSSKPMAFFAVILVIYSFLIIERKKYNSKFQEYFVYILHLLFYGLLLFLDETLIIIIPTLILLFFKKDNYLKLIFGMFCLFVWYLFWTKRGFSHIQTVLDYNNGAIDNYQAVHAININMIKNIFSNLIVNLKIVFQDTLGFYPIKNENGFFINAIMLINLAVFFVIITSNFSNIIKNLNRDTKRIFLSLFMVTFFNISVLQLAVKVWGIYWYSSLFPIYFSLVFAKLSSKLPRLLILSSTFLICLSTSISFHYTNLIYKKNHYDPYAPENIRSYFTGENNKFLENASLERKYSRKKITEVLYQQYMEKNEKITNCLFPDELEYVIVELLKEKYVKQTWMVLHRQKYFFDRLNDFDFSYTAQSMCENPTIKD
jgi:hypothetical protein